MLLLLGFKTGMMTLTLRTVLVLIAGSALCAEQTTSESPAPASVKPLSAPPGNSGRIAPANPKAPAPVAPAKTGKPDANDPKTKPQTLDSTVADDKDASSKPYVIGSLDVLSVTVWNDAKLSGFFDVRPDGMISMPLIGEMRADGLTVTELTALIKKKLNATVMEDPEVNVQVSKINSKKYYIYGGCFRQGEFPLTGSMTVLDAFANCGGFKDFANLKKVYILRGTQQLPFNYKDVSHGKHMEQNRLIQNGDRIFVPE
jgi:polysaccharide export outer membrane protein